MDDQFFAKLREIQKKERANSSLARVGSDFYKRTHKYLDSIRDVAVNDPFSEESDLLKNVQRIATEICEIREHKIADAAVMNIHRSYHLFQGKPQFDLVDTTPLNITEEEEKLYFSFIDVLKAHRRAISLDQLTTDDENIADSKIDDSNPQKNTDNLNANNKINKNMEENFKKNSNDITIDKNNIKNENVVKEDIDTDQVLNRLNNIKSAKVIEDEHYESIEKQISNSKKSVSSVQNEKNLQNTEDHLDSSNLSKSSKSSSPSTSSSNNSSNLPNSSISSSSSSSPSSNNSSNLSNSSKSQKSVKTGISKENISNDKKTNDIRNINDKSSDKVKKSDESFSNNLKKSKNSELANIMGNEDEQFINLDKIEKTDDFDSNNVKNINSSRSTVDNIVNAMILIFSDINPIIGVDEKIYGPFKSQDIVIMPDINADILVKSKKGRLVKI